MSDVKLIPWYDGTIREVGPLDIIELVGGELVMPYDELSYRRPGHRELTAYASVSDIAAVYHLEAFAPKVHEKEIELPTGLGAVIDFEDTGALTTAPYVKMYGGWVDCDGDFVVDADPRNALKDGAKVVYEGRKS